MASEKEKEMYFKARNRAIERVVDAREFSMESMHYFRVGLDIAHGTAPGLNLEFLSKELCPETNSGFAVICGLLAKVEARKGKGYKASWQKDGLLGSIWPNIQRKYDRADTVIHDGSDGVESLTETLADLTVYCVKTITWIAETKPEEVAKWIEYVRGL